MLRSLLLSDWLIFVRPFFLERASLLFLSLFFFFCGLYLMVLVFYIMFLSYLCCLAYLAFFCKKLLSLNHSHIRPVYQIHCPIPHDFELFPDSWKVAEIVCTPYPPCHKPVQPNSK